MRTAFEAGFAAGAVPSTSTAPAAFLRTDSIPVMATRDYLPGFLAAGRFAAGFLAAGFLAAGFRAAVVFFAAGFLAAVVFLAAGFFAAVFFAAGFAAFFAGAGT